MLRAPEDEAAAKAALRASLAKGNITPAAGATAEVVPAAEVVAEVVEETDEEREEREAEEAEAAEAAAAAAGTEETAEQKAEREAKEKIEAKAKRKDDRMQARIDRAVADKKAAETEIATLKAQLAANPDAKLTKEEVQAQAEAIAAKKIADKELADVQAKFQETCDKLQAEAKKVDKDFDAKVTDMATDFGPIPSFMINVLAEMDNGAEVLAFVAADDEVAEKVYGHKNSPAKLTKALVDISNKLADAKKPARRQISKVPDPITPVTGSRVASNAITEADTKNMESYVAKRQRQMQEKRKLQGF